MPTKPWRGGLPAADLEEQGPERGAAARVANPATVRAIGCRRPKGRAMVATRPAATAAEPSIFVCGGGRRSPHRNRGTAAVAASNSNPVGTNTLL